MSGKFLGIEMLRGVLALSVVAYHYFYYGPAVGRIEGQSSGDWLVYGRFGVSAFFLISGYVIAISAESGRWHRFLASRVSRLLPSAIVCATMTYLGYLAFSDVPLDMRAWIGSALLGPLLFNAPLIDASYWSIVVEMNFYALVLLLLMVRRSDQLLPVLTVFSVIMTVAYAAGAGMPSHGWLLFPHTSLFALGVLLHVAEAGRWTPGLVGLGSLHFVLASIGINIDFARADLMDGVRSAHPVGFAVVAVAVALLVIARRTPVPRGLVLPASLLGGVSYPIYLLHQEAGYLVINSLQFLMSTTCARVTAIAAMIAASLAIHLLLERPAVPWLRRTLIDLLDQRAAGRTETPHGREYR